MDERIMPGGPQGEHAPAANRPFGHAMTQSAQHVTVPIRDQTPAPPQTRSIPVQGGETTASGTDLPVPRSGEDEAVA